jgi:hypothetical protein
VVGLSLVDPQELSGFRDIRARARTTTAAGGGWKRGS